MEEKLDRRIRRTKEQLKRAMTQLLQEKSVREITVRELTERADVNRGTFYAHYSDLYDMLGQLENETLSDFEELLDRHAPEDMARDLTPLLTEVFSFAEQHRGLMYAFFGQQTADRFLRRFSQAIYDRCLREWAGLYPLGDVSEPNYYLEFVVAGTVNLVRTWARRGFGERPEEMAELTGRLILRGLESLGGEKLREEEKAICGLTKR